VVVVATSGVSAMIAPDGRILARTGVFTPALLERRLPLRDPLTLADRLGPLPEWVLSGAGLVALVLGWRAERRTRRREALDLDSRSRTELITTGD
jgi:apolipoprotein N-acyltransferase